MDCPAVYGPYTTVYNRFNRWSHRGRWQAIFEALVQTLPKDTRSIDSTSIKVQRSAAGGKGGAKMRKSGLDSPDDGGSDRNPNSGQGARFAERRYQCPSGGAGSRSSPAAAKRGVEDAGLEVGHASPDHQTCRSQPIASDNVR